MTTVVINENVNIDIRPVNEGTPSTTDISIGDLHANAIKLLYFLVRHGICNISEKHYARLVEIYRTPQSELTKELLDEYNAIVAGMEIINHDVLVRLIGDELGDRGSNDYFVLKILQKLKNDKAKVEILLSNHGVEFIEAYERFAERGNKFEISMLHFHAPSLARLADLIARGLVTAEEILEIVDGCYKPALKAISYSLDPLTHGITIFSHAGIGLQSIQALAKKFGVDYKDSTSIELAATIESINERFAKHVYANNVHDLLADAEMYRGYQGFIAFREDNPLEFIMWNRRYSEYGDPNDGYLARPTKHHGYPVSFVHGHDNRELTRDNIYVLDSDIGKAPHLHDGVYISLISNELQLQQLVALLCDDTAPADKAGGFIDEEAEEYDPHGDTPRVDAEEEAFHAPHDDAPHVHDHVDLRDKQPTSNKDEPASFTAAKEKFRYQLILLADKRNQLRERNEYNAYQAAKALHKGLEKAGTTYFQSPTETCYIAFKKECDELISAARPALETSRGWKQVLGNIALAILGLGVFYLAAVCYNKATTGRFLFFPTASAQRVDAIEQVINQPALAQIAPAV